MSKKLSHEMKKKIWTGSIVGAIAIIVIALSYWAMITFWLNNIVNIPYISYRYQLQEGNREVTITSIDVENAPTTFEIPSHIDGYPVTTIGDQAFFNFTRLEKVIMPDTITTIGNEAFRGCTNLREIIPSENINFIGENAFINTYYVDHMSEGFITLGQVIIAYNGTFEDNTALVASDSVKEEIERDHPDWTIVDITFDDVTSVTNSLFANQSGVVFAEIPASMTTIPSSLLANCSNLEEVRFHENITSIGANAFDNDISLKIEPSDLPQNLTSIGSYAFRGTAISGDFTFPDSLTTLGDGVFMNCVGLNSFILSENSNLTRIANDTFNGCTSLDEVKLPNNISWMGQRAFRNTALVEFNIPRSVSTIQGFAFENCTSLEKVVAYDIGLVEIGQSAFRNCPSFRTFQVLDDNGEPLPGSFEGVVMLPSTLTTFGASGNDGYIFAGNSAETAPKFTDVIIPSAISEIVGSQFRNNTHLRNVTFELEPTYDDDDGVTYNTNLLSIGAYAFAGCTSIEKLVLPETVEELNEGSFQGCTSLKSIYIPNNRGMTSIPARAFEGCSSLESITLPSRVGVIRTHAFDSCSSLDYIIIPNSITRMESSAFANSPNLAIYLDCNDSKVGSSTWPEDWVDETITKVYWQGEWELDENGVPHPIESVNA